MVFPRPQALVERLAQITSYQTRLVDFAGCDRFQTYRLRQISSSQEPMQRQRVKRKTDENIRSPIMSLQRPTSPLSQNGIYNFVYTTKRKQNAIQAVHSEMIRRRWKGNEGAKKSCLGCWEASLAHSRVNNEPAFCVNVLLGPTFVSLQIAFEWRASELTPSNYSLIKSKTKSFW